MKKTLIFLVTLFAGVTLGIMIAYIFMEPKEIVKYIENTEIAENATPKTPIVPLEETEVRIYKDKVQINLNGRWKDVANVDTLKEEDPFGKNQEVTETTENTEIISTENKEAKGIMNNPGLVSVGKKAAPKKETTKPAATQTVTPQAAVPDAPVYTPDSGSGNQEPSYVPATPDNNVPNPTPEAPTDNNPPPAEERSDGDSEDVEWTPDDM